MWTRVLGVVMFRQPEQAASRIGKARRHDVAVVVYDRGERADVDGPGLRHLLSVVDDSDPAGGLEQIERGENSSLRAAALHQVALTAYDSCDFDRAQRFARAALEATESDGDAAVFRGSALCLLGKVRWYADAGNDQEALALLHESTQSEEPGSRRRAIVLSSLAEILTYEGRAKDAADAVREAREIVEAIGDRLGAANLDVAAARVAVLRDDRASARRLIASARDVFHERPDPEAEALLAVAEAELAVAERRIADARRTLRAAAERAERSGSPFDVWTIRRLLDSAVLAGRRGESSASA